MTKPSPAEASKGHNRPPVLTADELARDFAYIDVALSELEALVDTCPPVAEDDQDIDQIRSVVKRCQGVHKRLEVVRVESKEPFLSATRICDSHFNARKERVAKWQSGLEAIAKRLLDKRAAEERAAREEAARKAAEEARIAQEQARKAEQERIVAEQARLQQEQERLAETFAAPSIAAAAPEVEETVTSADIEAARHAERTANTAALHKNTEALRAAEAAEAKPADLARVRSSDGVSTLQEIFKFEIEDLNAIDLNALREHLSLAHIETALRRYVSIHRNTRPLPGVRIYPDTKVMMT